MSGNLMLIGALLAVLMILNQLRRPQPANCLYALAGGLGVALMLAISCIG
jgi:hypothetical protein